MWEETRDLYLSIFAVIFLYVGPPFLRATLNFLRTSIFLSLIPHPKGHLILGNLAVLRPDHHTLFLEYAKELGGVYALRVFTVQVLVVVDAHIINQILGSAEGLSKGLEPDNSDVLMSHRRGHRTLFSSDTNGEWFNLIRKGTRGAFMSNNIRKGFPEVVKINNNVIRNLHSWGPKLDVDINNVTMRMAMDVTGLVGFAKDFKTTHVMDDPSTDQTFDTLRSAMLEAYKCATNPMRRFMFWDKEARGADDLFARFKSQMMKLTEEVLARGPVSDDDMSIAAHLMRLKDPKAPDSEKDRPLPKDLLAAEFGVYFAAGIESAGNAMSWTLYLISQHPEVEARLLRELDEHSFLATPARPKPPSMQYADLGKLTYLSQVCKEAMRVLPVASSGVTRRTKKGLRLNGYYVPAETLVVCPFYAAHHYAGNWPDGPDEFNPDRWLAPGAENYPADAMDEKSRSKRFLPFSTGPRQCIGQSLARMMHDLGVAMLLASFHFDLAPVMGGAEGVLATQINRLTLQPGSGLFMRCIARVPQGPWAARRPQEPKLPPKNTSLRETWEASLKEQPAPARKQAPTANVPAELQHLLGSRTGETPVFTPLTSPDKTPLSSPKHPSKPAPQAAADELEAAPATKDHPEEPLAASAEGTSKAMLGICRLQQPMARWRRPQ